MVIVRAITLPTEALAVIEQSVSDDEPRFDEMRLACDSLREQNRELAAQWLEWICERERVPLRIENVGSEPAGWFWKRRYPNYSLIGATLYVPEAVFKFMKPAPVVTNTTYNEASLTQAYVNLILAGEQSGLTPEQAERG